MRVLPVDAVQVCCWSCYFLLVCVGVGDGEGKRWRTGVGGMGGCWNRTYLEILYLSFEVNIVLIVPSLAHWGMVREGGLPQVT